MSTHALGSVSAVLAEHAGYFEVPGSHLYTVLHQVEEPVARLLLVAPFASERHSSYIPWALWARYLAGKGIEVLRYDYRGIGESEGVFGEMSFDVWTQDVHRLACWLKDRSPEVPLVLNGLGIGALLASLAFQAGVGEAWLLWSPPANANQALRASLVRWVNVDQLFKYGYDVFHRLKELRLRLRRSELPSNANYPLLQRWSSLASAGVPALVLKAPAAKASGAKPKLGEFDYLEHVIRLAGSRGRVDLQVIGCRSLFRGSGRTTGCSNLYRKLSW